MPLPTQTLNLIVESLGGHQLTQIILTGIVAALIAFTVAMWTLGSIIRAQLQASTHTKHMQVLQQHLQADPQFASRIVEAHNKPVIHGVQL